MNRFVAAFLLALFSFHASADEPRGFFIEAGIGQTKYEISQQNLDQMTRLLFGASGLPVSTVSSTFDDGGSSWSVVGGWRFSPYFALEGGYTDLSSAKYNASATSLLPSATPVLAASADISSKGPTLAVAGFVPIGKKFDVHGRLGMYFADTAMHLDVSGANLSGTAGFVGSIDHSGKSQDLFLGIGAAFHFSKRLAISLDYSLLNDVGDGEGPLFKDVGYTDVTGKRNIGSVTVGLRSAF